MSEHISRRAALAGVSVTALTLAAGSTTAEAAQPNMEKALNHLRQARKFLRAAAHNKGGHRANAVRQVERAIESTKKGIDHAG